MESFRGKRILVMGLGLHGGGLGVVKFLLREGAKKVIITDLRKKSELLSTIAEIPKHSSISFVLGQHRAVDFQKCDAIIKNPGVPPNSPFLLEAIKSGVPILSDVGIFFGRVKTPVIGVTGTKGKSTTATLISLLLKGRYPKTFLAGNIRKSVLDIIGIANRADYVVLELSSFQLEDLSLEKVSPHIAVITSISMDHLNRHKTFTNYKRVKGLVTEFQKSDDIIIIPKGKELEPLIYKTKAQKVLVNLHKGRKEIEKMNPYFRGHMTDAALLALAVAREVGVASRDALSQLEAFRPLEGRMEKIRNVRGVHFINDTTATAPAAAAADLKLLSQKNNIILIAGGVDKDMDFHEFAKAIHRYTKFVIFLPGTATKKILAALGNKMQESTAFASSMAEAVKESYKRARRGDIVLLSPGAASFNLFSHEFHRGQEFTDAVRKLR